MRGRGRGGISAAASGALAAALTLAGCSTTDGSSAAAGDPTFSNQAMNAQVACDKYYAFELFRITEVAINQDADEGQRAQALKDYRDLATSMAASVESAVTVGDLPARAQANADRILRQLARVSAAGGDIWDVSRTLDARIAKSATRIGALCVAAGQPAPQEIQDARESAHDD
jgi:hypothetical protein